MGFLFIFLLGYCGLGLILLENKDKWPTAWFRRGIPGSCALRSVFFVLFWSIILWSPGMPDRWSRLRHIHRPQSPVVMGAVVFLLAGALVLGAYQPAIHRELPVPAAEEGLSGSRTGQAAAGAEAALLPRAGLSVADQPLLVKPKGEEWLSLAQVAPVSIDGIRGLYDAGGEPAAMEKGLTGFLSMAGNYPEASTRELTQADLANRSVQELRLIRNEIFARHSYIFVSEEMRAYFSQMPWYIPRYPSVAAMLNEYEKKNIILISGQENR